MLRGPWAAATLSLFLLGLAACATPEPVLITPEPEPAPVAVTPKPDFKQIGKASWYGEQHEGKPTASGEPFDPNALTAAHRTLPLDTKARVTNLENGRSVDVTVNDRGPFVKGRVIDLSKKAATDIGLGKDGTAKVKIEVVREKKNAPVAEAKAE